MKHDPGLTAACLLALFPEPDIDDEEYVRRYVGGLVIAEAFHELTLIRKALTEKK